MSALRRTGGTLLAGVVVVLIVVGSVVAVLALRTPMKTVVAMFPTVEGIYTGDDVAVLGVSVGRITQIEPLPDQVRVTMEIQEDIDVPSDVQAAIVAQSLVSARNVALSPVYRGGPTLADGEVIPISRTAVPVEYDQFRDQLSALAQALGPNGANADGSVSAATTAAADVLRGNGQSLNDTVTQLSAAVTTLSDGRTDLFATVRNLQTLVTALSASGQAIVTFDNRLESVTSLLTNSPDELGSALTSLNAAVTDLGQFVGDNRAAVDTSVERLASVSQALNDSRDQLAEVLHKLPNATANFQNIYRPASASLNGQLALTQYANPVQFLCGSVQGLGTLSSEAAAKVCYQQLAPIVGNDQLNYPIAGTKLPTGVGALPSQVDYSDPALVPGAAGGPTNRNDLILPGGGS